MKRRSVVHYGKAELWDVNICGVRGTWHASGDVKKVTCKRCRRHLTLLGGKRTAPKEKMPVKPCQATVINCVALTDEISDYCVVHRINPRYAAGPSVRRSKARRWPPMPWDEEPSWPLEKIYTTVLE